MGNKGRKGHNWKSRQVLETVIDDSETKKIKLDLDVQGNFDNCNALVLPSQKRQTKVKNENLKNIKILSKKQRRRLEKVVEKKAKKGNRTSLLEALSQHQMTPLELSKLTSITSIQTKGLRRYFQDLEKPESNKIEAVAESNSKNVKVNSLKGAKRKRLDLIDGESRKSSDPNVLGFDSSSDSDFDEECNEEVTKKSKLDEIDVNETLEQIPKEEKKVEDTKNCTIIKDMQEVPAKSVDNKEKTKKNNKKGKRKPEPLISIPAVFVQVNRKSSVQKARLKLPILAEEQQIMETINENAVVILAGETGSGKTTQVPQFLYEGGYALNKMIAVTEPRRVAAISMSRRVAEEMNLTSKEVSYLIRFEGNVTDDTKIKFMTDGVLLKEIQTDFLLSKYSVVILDEAHERSVYTDILIGLLSRIAPMRNNRGDPLKLIIMSATLRLEDFVENSQLFRITPPVIKVDARQFPVTIHFNKRTHENYLQEAFNKVGKIHTQLPEGGILVFVTGQQEVNTLVKKLRQTFKFNNKAIEKKAVEEKDAENSDAEIEEDSDEELIDISLKKKLKSKRGKSSKVEVVSKINLDDYGMPGDNELNSENESCSEDEDETVLNDLSFPKAKPLWVLPLYSLLPSEKQAEVFKNPPKDYRLCIVSTNVAETSLTIPNVRYVVDTGKSKVKLYDKVTGVTSYTVSWASKASADQRAGRAGRTGPGHCYRLYSSAIFNDEFKQFSVPEIQQKPVDDLYLQMKCMNIDKVVNFPFPTVPDLEQLKTAEKRLEILGALEKSRVTPLGRAISKFPVLPRFGKMLALSHQHNLLPYTICMVASLSVQEVLLETPVGSESCNESKSIRQKWFATRLKWAGTNNSLLLGDPMVLLRAVGASEYANSQGRLEEFCQENGLRHKAVIEIRKLRIQLTNEIKMNVPDSDIVVDPKLQPPTDFQSKLLRQILLSGMGDQVAKKIMPDELKESEDKIKFKYAYRAYNMEEPIFLHQGSVLKRTLPEYVIFQEIYETNKMYMRGVTAIEPEWLPIYVANACKLSEPLSEPEPRFEPSDGKMYCTVTGTFGIQSWQLPRVEVPFSNSLKAYEWFARFILEGKVLPKLSKYKDVLSPAPNVMNKTWRHLHPKTSKLVQPLIAKRVYTKKTLLEMMEENPKFLLEQYLQWLPESAQSEVMMFWPPLED